MSFYNESQGARHRPDAGHRGARPHRRARRARRRRLRSSPAQRIVVLGATDAELGGSEWAALHGLTRGTPPRADLEVARRAAPLVRRAGRRAGRRRRARLRRRRARGRAWRRWRSGGEIGFTMLAAPQRSGSRTRAPRGSPSRRHGSSCRSHPTDVDGRRSTAHGAAGRRRSRRRRGDGRPPRRRGRLRRRARGRHQRMAGRDPVATECERA